MYRNKKNICTSSHTTLLLIIGLLSFCYNQSVIAEPLHPEIKVFISKMVKNHGFKEHYLKKIFNKIKIKSSIIKTISRPSTSKPWHEYYPVFINQKRISKGVSFWKKNAKTLKRASKEFGVPKEIITALIGVKRIMVNKLADIVFWMH